MNTVAQTIAKFQAGFNPEAAAGNDYIFQFNVTDDKTYCLNIKDGQCTASEGVNEDANVTLVTDSATLMAMSDGSLDGMQAFMSGKLRIEGDMMLSLKLNELFSK